MVKHKWEKAWQDKKFEIRTLIPSILVSKHANRLKPGDNILDIGCGNGRNAIYLAKQGCRVDCFDVADLQWVKHLPSNLQNKINFKKSNILDYPYVAHKYRAVVLARVIQYLSPEELSFVLSKIKYGLEDGGFILLSYSMKGGIFNRPEIGVSTHMYPIEELQATLEKIFSTVIINKGSSVNKHVNYTDNITSFDIYASL